MNKLIMLMMLLMTFQSCRDDNYPRIQDQEQLSPIFKYVEIEGKQYIDIDKSKCLSRTYRITRGYIGGIDKAIKLHIKECNKVVGYAPSEYGVFATWMENFRHWLLGF